MATVPIYNGPQVEERALPDARVNVGGVSPDAFGGVRARQISQLGQIAQNFAGDLLEKQRRDKEIEDGTLVFDAGAKAKKDDIDFKSNMRRTMQGQLAAGAAQTAEKFYGDLEAKYSQQFTNERQKNMFRPIFEKLRSSGYDHAVRWEEQEMQLAFGEKMAASKAMTFEHTIADPTPTNVASALSEIQAYNQMSAKGKPPEWLAWQNLEDSTKLHKGVIDSMVTRDVNGADAYFEQHKNQIAGSHHEGIKESIYSGWYNAASTIAIKADATNDINTLKLLQKDAIDDKGLFSQKLDSKHRAMLVNTVTNHIDRIETRAQAQANQRERKAETALAQIDEQITSAIPAKPEQWSKWGEVTKGTSYETDFNERVQAEIETQKLLRMPMQDQQAEVQHRTQALLQNGGSVRDQANIARLEKSVTNNVKLITERPLDYLESRAGIAVQPVPIEALNNLASAPAAARNIESELQNRAALVSAVQKRNNMRVHMALLKDQEAEKLSAAFSNDEIDVSRKAVLLQNLRAVAGSTEVYKALLTQVAPKAPIAAYAGQIMAAGGEATLQDGGLFGADVVAKANTVAETLLKGERILKGKDGKFPLPKDADFNTAFFNKTSGVFAGRPDAYQTAMQATKAYYIGKASADGDTSGVVDSDRMEQAINAALGSVVDRGDKKLLAPWGMSADAFEDKISEAWGVESKRLNLPPDVVDSWEAYDLQQVGGSTYAVTVGAMPLLDGTGRPVLLDVRGR